MGKQIDKLGRGIKRESESRNLERRQEKEKVTELTLS